MSEADSKALSRESDNGVALDEFPAWMPADMVERLRGKRVEMEEAELEPDARARLAKWEAELADLAAKHDEENRNRGVGNFSAYLDPKTIPPRKVKDTLPLIERVQIGGVAAEVNSSHVAERDPRAGEARDQEYVEFLKLRLRVQRAEELARAQADALVQIEKERREYAANAGATIGPRNTAKMPTVAKIVAGEEGHDEPISEGARRPDAPPSSPAPAVVTPDLLRADPGDDNARAGRPRRARGVSLLLGVVAALAAGAVLLLATHHRAFSADAPVSPANSNPMPSSALGLANPTRSTPTLEQPAGSAPRPSVTSPPSITTVPHRSLAEKVAPPSPLPSTATAAPTLAPSSHPTAPNSTPKPPPIPSVNPLDQPNYN